MQPDFNRLKVFYHVFSRQSIVAAAEDLHVSQPAISQHIQKLESELKTPLFTRLHKRLVPTVAGERLFGIVKPFVESLESELRDLEKARETPFGLLRIGAPAEFGKQYIPPIMSTFRRAYPDVVFHLELGEPAEMLPMVRDGHLHFALVDVFLTSGEPSRDFDLFHIESVVDEEVIMACSCDYYEEKVKGNHSFERLSGLEFISYRPSALALRGWFRHHLKRQPGKLNVVLTVDSVPAVISAIAHDIGLGVTASHLAKDDISRGRIVPIRTQRDEVINRISLVQLKDKVPGLTDRMFQKHLRLELERIGLKKLGHSE